MPTNRPWTPLLSGAALDDAHRRIDVIAERLAAEAPVSGAECGLVTGALGAALFHAYLERARPGQGHLGRAAAIVERAIDALPDHSDEPNLFNGFLGTGWLVAHLADELGAGPDSNDPIDDAVITLLDEGALATLGFEWVSGVAGAGVYAIERLPAAGGAAILERVVHALDRLGERCAPGVRWRMPAWMPLVRNNPARFPGGCYALDPAHGALGPIAVLAAACAAGVASASARPLLDASVEWLLAQQMDGERSRFPSYAGERTGWPAWCAGDPGVVGVLASAAEAAGEPAWSRVAHETARFVAAHARVEETRGLGLCHGLAGLLHVLDRARWWFGDESIAAAARDVAGALLAHDDAASAGATLLEGDAGVGLALLAAVGDSEPAWDRLFMLSPR